MAGKYEAEVPNKIIQSPRGRIVLYAAVIAVAVAAILATLISAGVLTSEQVKDWGATFTDLLGWLVALAVGVLAIVNVPKEKTADLNLRAHPEGAHGPDPEGYGE